MTWKQRLLWLLQHWYLPFSIFGTALVYGLFRRGGHASAQDKLNVELAAVSAKLGVSAVQVQQGTDAAITYVRATYATTLRQLDERETHAAVQLRDHPADLAAFLVRAGGAVVARPNPPPGNNNPGVH